MLARMGRKRTSLPVVWLLVGAAALAACDTAGPPLRTEATSTSGFEVAPTTSAPTTTSTEPPTTSVPPSTTAPPPPPAPAIPPGDDVTVSRVTDGDTIVVNGDLRVRLIGVDTPEITFGKNECYGYAARDFVAREIGPGTRVRLVYDANRYDRYGRTLAYVFRLADAAHINAALLLGGYAAAYPFDDTPARHIEFAADATLAYREGRGGWSACRGADGPLAGPPVK